MLPNPQHILLLHQLRVFLDAAAAAGVHVAPLKGAHLITGVYPAGEDRGGMCDVDVLVPPEHFDVAGEVLEALGYCRRELRDRRRTEAEFYEAGYRRDLGGGRRVMVEVHRYFVQPQRAPVDYAALWARAEPATLEGAPCLRLRPEDHLLHAAMHLMTDRFEAPARGLRDAEHLIVRAGAELGLAAERAVRWRCGRPLWLTFALLAEAAPQLRERLAPHIQALRPPPLARALARALVPTAAGLRWSSIGRRPGQALLWPALLDGMGHAASFGAYYLRLRAADLVEGRDG